MNNVIRYTLERQNLDKRKYDRINCNFLVDINLDGINTPKQGILKNISLGGCLIESKDVLPEQSSLFLESRHLNNYEKIFFSVSHYFNNENGHFIGIHFDQNVLSNDMAVTIMKMVRKQHHFEELKSAKTATLVDKSNEIAILKLEESLISQLHTPYNEQITELIQHGHKNIIINLAQVNYMTSLMVGFLIKYSNFLKQNGGQLRICNVTESAKKILLLMKIQSLINIDKSLEDSINSIKEKISPGDAHQ